MDKGGLFIPKIVADQIAANARREIDALAKWVIANSPPAPPLTTRQRLGIRIRIIRWGIRERIHDRLFPDCHNGDEW